MAVAGWRIGQRFKLTRHLSGWPVFWISENLLQKIFKSGICWLHLNRWTRTARRGQIGLTARARDDLEMTEKMRHTHAARYIGPQSALQ